jgi:hypothetical protein
MAARLETGETDAPRPTMGVARTAVVRLHSSDPQTLEEWIMSRGISRRGITLLVTLGALLSFAFAAAPHADAATLYACVKKHGGSMRLVGQGTKCRRSERKVSWSTTGPAGENGNNGANGANGAPGKNGASGTNLTTQTPLASGQSESGWFAVGGGSSATDFVGQGVSFSQPLSAPLLGKVVFNLVGVTSPTCPGVGAAAPGFVCIYTAEIQAAAFDIALDFKLDGESADRFGFALYFKLLAAEGFADGSWTVTAP